MQAEKLKCKKTDHQYRWLDSLSLNCPGEKCLYFNIIVVKWLSGCKKYQSYLLLQER